MYSVDPFDGLVGRLPEDLSADVDSVRAALERSPSTVGRPWTATNPTGMRVVVFGEGRALLVFGVIESERRVFLVSLILP